MANRIFAMFCIFMISIHSYGKDKRNKVLLTNLKYLWEIDSCETKGFRGIFYNTIANNETKKKSFKLKDIKYICGNPNNIDTVRNTVIYEYFSYDGPPPCGSYVGGRLFIYARYVFYFNRIGRLIDIHSNFMVE